MKKYTHILLNRKSYILLFLFCLSIVLYAEAPPIERLTGINWFGFETGDYVAHGLWSRDYKSMLMQMRDLGFNCVRIPFSNEMLDKNPVSITISEWVTDLYTGQMGLNMELEGKSSIEVLDEIIKEAGRLGLRIILDCHSRAADAYMEETLWYTDEWPESKWISDWVLLAQRYLNEPNVIAFDINNEPHGGLLGEGMKPPASWGYDVPDYGITDWKAAAERCSEAILQVHPDIIIIMQGVQESSDGSNYWWGSNHKDLTTYPITSIPASRLMFSVHEYGPSVSSQLWFDDPSFPDNLEDLWRDRFWFIYEEDIAGLYIGEMGLKEEEASDPSSIAYQWFTKWLEFAGNKVHWTYWCWNPNSFDTGGILKEDWVTVNQVKYNLIQPYLEPIGPTQIPTPPAQQTPYPTNPPNQTQPPPFTPEPTNSDGLIIDAQFTSSTDGFTYVDDPFRDTDNPNYASGSYDSYGGISGGGLRVYLGAANTNGPVSGGWSENFSSAGDITINLDYRLTMGSGYDTDEYAEVIVSVDGILHILNTIYGGGSTDTGWINESITIDPGPENHTIIIGVYNSNASGTNEWVDFYIDNVRVGDDDNPPVNLGDVNNDGNIDIVDSLVIAQYYVGLDPQNFHPENADVNCDFFIDIVDALLISQYYVGLIVSFC